MRSEEKMNSDKPRSILKNTSYGNIIQQEDSLPANQPQISWLSSSNSQPSSLANTQRAKRSPERPIPTAANKKDQNVNVEGLKNTLSSLMEEKSNLERQLRTGHSLKGSEDVKFELELALNNIKRV